MSVVRARQNMWANLLQYLILGPRSGIWNTVMCLASPFHVWERVTNLRMGIKNNHKQRMAWPTPLLITFFGGRYQYYTYKIVRGSRFSFLK